MERRSWDELPESVREDVQQQCGAVLKAESAAAGIMPGLAARLHIEDGTSVFLKAIEAAHPGAGLHRREAGVSGALPPEAAAPRLLRHGDQSGWLWMVFEHINDNARHADLSPGSPDLPIVLDTMSTLGALLTPAPKDCRPVIDNIIALLGKATRMMDKPPAVLPDRDLYGDALDYYNPGDYRGNTLLHYDLSASNLLVTRGRVYAIDWSFAARGASWIDGAMLAPRLIEAGHRPVEADRLLSSLPSWTAAPRRSLACLAALWTLFRLYKALYGPEEVREGRARAAEAGKAWLRYQLAA